MRRIFILISLLFSHYAVSMTESEEVQLSSNRIVGGILSFSHWPNLKGEPLLCVSSKSSYFNIGEEGNNKVYKVLAIHNSAEFLSAGCNAVYFGQEPVKKQNNIIQYLLNKNVLTLSESNDDCVSGTAFCIYKRQQKIKFSVNLDSLSRTGVSVNSEVLLLSKDGDE